MHTFTQGPNILVTINASGESIKDVSLSLSDAFICSIKGASTALEKKLLKWLTDYSLGKSQMIEMPYTGTAFRKKVVESIHHIPFGHVKSYKQVAEDSDCPKGARAVGLACRSNYLPLFIPCHRVIASGGGLGGFMGGARGFLEIKKRLLAFESEHHKED